MPSQVRVSAHGLVIIEMSHMILIKFSLEMKEHASLAQSVPLTRR